MARMPRLVVPGYPHHVTQRGNRRQQTFFGEGDYRYYRELLAESAQSSGTAVWAYCLMPNHVHLVLVPSHEDGLRACLGEVHRQYTRRVNFRHGWRGHLWQERFHSFVMDEAYLLATVRYVERNPVAAKLCDRPQDWRWSSARAHMSGKDDLLVQVDPMLDRVPACQWQSYLSRQGSCTCSIDDIQKHTRTGRPLGDDSFLKRLEAATGVKLAKGKPGPKCGGVRSVRDK